MLWYFHPVWLARTFREVTIVRRGALKLSGRPSRARMETVETKDFKILKLSLKLH